MAQHELWDDRYWLLLLQQYLKKPIGVKPLFSKEMVNLSLELHIAPEYLHRQMFKLRNITPGIKRLWDKYGNNPQALACDIAILKGMEGCGNAKLFYEGVAIKESFEKDWRPLEEEPTLTPVKLIIILDLYFQLTPITMVPGTPEVRSLGNLINTTPDIISKVMAIFRYCDPYLSKKEAITDSLLGPCQEIWQRFGNDNPNKLYTYALELKEYYK